MTMREEVKRNMLNELKHFATSLMLRLKLASEEGQTLVEYSLILALVSVTAVVALEALSGGIIGIFGAVQAALEAA
jgi:Flp pilus assembly pilin Flp